MLWGQAPHQETSERPRIFREMLRSPRRPQHESLRCFTFFSNATLAMRLEVMMRPAKEVQLKNCGVLLANVLSGVWEQDFTNS